MNATESARRSLDGLALGDALGKALAYCEGEGEGRRFPPGPLPFTDDTIQARVIVDHLEARGSIDEPALARAFAEAWAAEPERGYGAVAYWMLARFHQGEDPQAIAQQVFQGEGSKGNGAAMRVAPLGAFFADQDPGILVAQAQRSAAVTHRHPEGQAGAIAVALAAASLTRAEPASGVLRRALEGCPAGATREGLERARTLGPTSLDEAAAALGLGVDILAEDTVPFALWVVAHFGEDLTGAIAAPMAVLESLFESDRDTILAIIGGVVGARGDPLPEEWWARCEHP